MSSSEETDSEPVRIPITGELDLHTFAPRELPMLLPAYLDECVRQGIFSVRIIHGKGSGVLRDRVRSMLRRLPMVLGYKSGDEHSGGWGATIVSLRPNPPEASANKDS